MTRLLTPTASDRLVKVSHFPAKLLGYKLKIPTNEGKVEQIVYSKGKINIKNYSGHQPIKASGTSKQLQIYRVQTNEGQK